MQKRLEFEAVKEIKDYTSTKLSLKQKQAVVRRCCLKTTLFNKVAGLKEFNFIKKRLQHMLSSEYFEIFYRTLFYRTPPVTASVSKTIKPF